MFILSSFLIGVTFFSFIFLELPFFDQNLVELMKKIENNM